MNKIRNTSSYVQRLLSRDLDFEVRPVLVDFVCNEAAIQAVSILEDNFVAVRAGYISKVQVVAGLLS